MKLWKKMKHCNYNKVIISNRSQISKYFKTDKVNACDSGLAGPDVTGVNMSCVSHVAYS